MYLVVFCTSLSLVIFPDVTILYIIYSGADSTNYRGNEFYNIFFQSPSKKKQSARSKKTEDLHVPTSFSFGQLKSPKLVKPVFVFGKEKQKTPATSRKSLCSVNKAKENETPFESRKSIASTPFGYVLSV